jgi:hypothetical protein
MEGKAANLTPNRRCWAHLQENKDMKKPRITNHFTEDLIVSLGQFDPHPPIFECAKKEIRCKIITNEN